MQNKYEVMGIVGEGAYGIVYKCRNKETNDYVAIKKFKETEDEIVKKTMKRELRVLQLLKNENIVEFKEAFKKKGNLYLVFEYVEKNLLEILQETPKGLDPGLIKNVIYQLCKAIKYLHDMSIIHRDIKPENLLIDANLKLKLCDFGFARTIKGSGKEHLTDYVATRWYRSPELLITSGVYGTEIDYWAIGCIMGELIDGNPLFPGENETDQLHVIQKVLGNLTDEQMDLFYKNPLYHGRKLLDVSKPETLERRYMGKMSKVGISFMKSLLSIDPRTRLIGEAVFQHPYFECFASDYKSKNNTITEKTAVLNNDHKFSPTNSNNISKKNTIKPQQAQVNNTTNINIINYNTFNPTPTQDLDNAEKSNLVTANNITSYVEKVEPVKKTFKKTLTVKNADVQKLSNKSLNNLNSNLNAGVNNVAQLNQMNMTTGSKLSKNSTDNHLYTSFNFNKNFKDNLNLISLLPGTNLDSAYKTFYKNKDDKYNFDIDLNAINSNSNIKNIPIQQNQHPTYRGKEIIDETVEIARDEKKKSKSLNPMKKKTTDSNNNYQDSSPLNKNKGSTTNAYSYNNASNKSSSPLKNLNFNSSNKSLGNTYGVPGTVNGMKNMLPSISKNHNLKRFSQLISK